MMKGKVVKGLLDLGALYETLVWIHLKPIIVRVVRDPIVLSQTVKRGKYNIIKIFCNLNSINLMIRDI